ncbi:hypothetical protein [Alcaligenes sp. Marseille-Q7550]
MISWQRLETMFRKFPDTLKGLCRESPSLFLSLGAAPSTRALQPMPPGMRSIFGKKLQAQPMDEIALHARIQQGSLDMMRARFMRGQS